MTTEDHIHFTWEGVLEAGEGKMFKFLTNESISNESWLPSYGRNAESENYWALALRTAESDGDAQFKVDKTGNYVLTVDIENMVMSAEFKGDGKPHFYGIGDPLLGHGHFQMLRSSAPATRRPGLGPVMSIRAVSR